MTSIFLTLALFAACDNKISYDDYVIPSDNVYTAVPDNDFLGSIGVNSSIDTRGENLEKDSGMYAVSRCEVDPSGYGGKDIPVFDYLIENGGIKFSIAVGTGSSAIDVPLEAARYLKAKDAL